jgi:hypothetical protein
MLWLEHIAIGFLYNSIFPYSTTFSIVVGSCMPDVFMAALPLMGKHMDSIEYPYTQLCYFLPHSFVVLPLVPKRLRIYYALHIVCDCISHTGPWSIMTLYPITTWQIEGFYDPWKVFFP